MLLYAPHSLTHPRSHFFPAQPLTVLLPLRQLAATLLPLPPLPPPHPLLPPPSAPMPLPPLLPRTLSVSRWRRRLPSAPLAVPFLLSERCLRGGFPLLLLPPPLPHPMLL